MENRNKPINSSTRLTPMPMKRKIFLIVVSPFSECAPAGD